MNVPLASTLILVSVLCAACGGDAAPSQTPTGSDVYPAGQNGNRDILATALDVSLTTLEATATISIAGSDSAAASFEAQGLEVLEVRNDDGPLEWEQLEGRLDVGVAPSDEPLNLEVAYRFRVQDDFDGWLASGSTLLWPYHCGNLFPCRSTPSDGLTFSLDIHDDPEGRSILFPTAISADAPSYMAAWAVGDYQQLDVGVTPAGTRLTTWYLPGGASQAQAGVAYLVDAFDYFEQTLGLYAFGDQAGGISVSWGAGALGGMEHHPYWHIADDSMSLPDVQVHEAAHGWFGDGIRIRCWEDFVLSEGTVSYLTARAYAEVAPAAETAALWDSYQGRLDSAMATQSWKIAWPDSCGEVDILDDGLFSSIPYMKGAFFFRALENKIGVPALMGALAHFYADRVGSDAGMQDLLDRIEEDTGYDPMPCADAWLRQAALPSDDSCP